jgi:hypothetical protein
MGGWGISVLSLGNARYGSDMNKSSRYVLEPERTPRRRWTGSSLPVCAVTSQARPWFARKSRSNALFGVDFVLEVGCTR